MKSLKSELKHQIDLLGAKWQNGGKFEVIAFGLGFKASNASRRLRELAEDGLIERKYEKGSVWYRAKPMNVLCPECGGRHDPRWTEHEPARRNWPEENIKEKLSTFPSAFPKKEEKTQGLF